MYKFLSVTTVFVLFCMASLKGADDLADLEPKHARIFAAKLELSKSWVGALVNMRMELSSESIQSLFKGLKFKPFYCGHPVGQDDTDHILGRFDGAHRLKEAVIHQAIYTPESLELSLQPQVCPRNSIFVSRKPEYVCNPLSWKWVSYALEYISESEVECSPRRTDLLKKIPARIDKYGLEKAFTRMATVTNVDGVCAFYAIYDTEEEREASTDVLERLKAHVIKTYGEDFIVG